MKAEYPRKIFVIESNNGSITLQYPAPEFSNYIPIEKEERAPFALALLAEADMKEIREFLDKWRRQEFPKHAQPKRVDYRIAKHLLQLRKALDAKQALEMEESDET